MRTLNKAVVVAGTLSAIGALMLFAIISDRQLARQKRGETVYIVNHAIAAYGSAIDVINSTCNTTTVPQEIVGRNHDWFDVLTQGRIAVANPYVQCYDASGIRAIPPNDRNLVLARAKKVTLTFSPDEGGSRMQKAHFEIDWDDKDREALAFFEAHRAAVLKEGEAFAKKRLGLPS